MTNYCGYIALVGQANVGKSSLLNRILDCKLSITSNKPQTTRHKILGIQTRDNYQYIYVDTPGIHSNIQQRTMNRMMNKIAKIALYDVDIIAFVVDGLNWNERDDYILNLIKQTSMPCILLINKIDKIPDKLQLLPYIKRLSKTHTFAEIIPLSAKTGNQVECLEKKLQDYLPIGSHIFTNDQYTNCSARFLCAELLREKIFRFCGQELPYATTVTIEAYQEEDELIKIHALIFVEKLNHKRIIVGNKGKKLKEIASLARADMEKLLGKQIYLQCWCKVNAGWNNNEQLLRQLGYEI